MVFKQKEFGTVSITLMRLCVLDDPSRCSSLPDTTKPASDLYAWPTFKNGRKGSGYRQK